MNDDGRRARRTGKSSLFFSHLSTHYIGVGTVTGIYSGRIQCCDLAQNRQSQQMLIMTLYETISINPIANSFLNFVSYWLKINITNSLHTTNECKNRHNWSCMDFLEQQFVKVWCIPIKAIRDWGTSGLLQTRSHSHKHLKTIRLITKSQHRCWNICM